MQIQVELDAGQAGQRELRRIETIHGTGTRQKETNDLIVTWADASDELATDLVKLLDDNVVVLEIVIRP